MENNQGKFMSIIKYLSLKNKSQSSILLEQSVNMIIIKVNNLKF